MGDLNPTTPFKGTLPAGGLFFRKHWNNRWAYKFSGSYGYFRASDKNSLNAYQRARNLDVRSYVGEVSGQVEFNFLQFHGEDIKYYWSPFVFIGLSVFNFYPKGTLNGDYVPLRKNNNEAQGLGGVYKSNQYKLIQPSIPFGLGVKYQLNRRFNFSAEWGMRKTFTDYLDDVSRYYAPVGYATNPELADKANDPDPITSNTGRQRGNFATKDWYSFFGVCISFKLKDPDGTCPAFK